ncbi:MAG: TerC family protein [Salinibacterium sp.]|nr:TerC family protein [Salinibacterium sp.]
MLTDEAVQAATQPLLSWHSAGALVALTSLEIVLGIDNVVFLSILASRLEESKQKLARRVGLLLAMVGRILLLLVAGFVMSLNNDWFTLFGRGFSGKDLFLLAGGAFLVYKATHEIHHLIAGHRKDDLASKAAASFGIVLFQILLMDLVFSIDSVITAVGMTPHLPIMIAAVVISIAVMIAFAEFIATFIERHPSFKMLGLAFLVLIGVMLAAEGLGEHIDRAYVYVAMAFALLVEVLQMLTEKRNKKRKAARAAS